MKKFVKPDPKEWAGILARPVMDASNLQEICREVFTSVTMEGDVAVNRYAEKFDGNAVSVVNLDQDLVEKVENEIGEELSQSIRKAADNIEQFHRSQAGTVEKITTTAGVTCWREDRPIEKVGLYIPGGTAPLFSTVLMLGIPARIAGSSEVVLCTPPDKDGNIPPAVLFAAHVAGITKVYAVGGIQAIAAMSLGTNTIPQVYKIFGPGNQYVTAAKQYAFSHGTAIDLPAGPSEVLVIADENANPGFVAADLLSQAEHGIDSQVVLLTPSSELIGKVEDEINAQLELLPRAEIARESLEKSILIELASLEDCVRLSNFYAPEHLILMVKEPAALTAEIVNAGSVFMGYYTPESAGDYASGTNHTLPTNGYARGYSGVSLDSFIKKVTFQEITADGLKNLGPAIESMAEAEQLMAHKEAVSIRLKEINNV